MICAIFLSIIRKTWVSLHIPKKNMLNSTTNSKPSSTSKKAQVSTLQFLIVCSFGLESSLVLYTPWNDETDELTQFPKPMVILRRFAFLRCSKVRVFSSQLIEVFWMNGGLMCIHSTYSSRSARYWALSFWFFSLSLAFMALFFWKRAMEASLRSSRSAWKKS